MKRLTTVAAVAAEIARVFGMGTDEVREAEALRLALSFVERFDRAAEGKRDAMIRDRPVSVGDARFDALLAAIVEHLCAKCDRPAPGWTQDEDRFLETWWFVSGLRSLHADALVHSPISFSRRGVFITENALSYA